MKTLRTFVAVDLPPKFRPDIARIERELDTPGLKLVRPDLIHVTLKFLGDVPEERIDAISDALRSIKLPPFQARIGGMGAFPGKSVRVVWLGLEGNFEELQKQVEEVLMPFGFEGEERKFTPHLTLGRVGRPNPDTSRQISAKISKLADTQLGEFTVDRFHLKMSTLTPGGPIYEDLTELRL